MRTAAHPVPGSARRSAPLAWLREESLAGMARRRALMGYLFIFPTVLGILLFTAGPVVDYRSALMASPRDYATFLRALARRNILVADKPGIDSINGYVNAINVRACVAYLYQGSDARAS